MSEQYFLFEEDPKVSVKRTKPVPAKLKEFFPISMENPVPEMYEVPQGYISEEFWGQVVEKLGEWTQGWKELRRQIFQDLENKSEDKESGDKAKKTEKMIRNLLDSYEALQNACEDTKEPIPRDLFENLWDELKKRDEAVSKACGALGRPVTFSPFSWPNPQTKKEEDSPDPKYDANGKYKTLKAELESFEADGPLHSYIARNILYLFSYVYDLAEDVDIEEQEDMFPILVSLLSKYKQGLCQTSYKELRDAIDNLAEECSDLPAPDGKFNYQPLPKTLKELKEAMTNGFTRKEKFVRRSQREKKPIKLESMEEESKKDSVEEKPYPAVAKDERKLRARPKRESKPARKFTPPHDKAEGEDSDELEEFVSIPTPKKVKRRSLTNEGKCEVKEPVRKMARKELSSKFIPKIPAEKISENDLLIREERIFLQETKMHLLLLRHEDGKFALSFVPTILKSIDSALAALDELANIDYAMHKCAVEVGVGQLMRDLRSQAEFNAARGNLVICEQSSSPEQFEQGRFSQASHDLEGESYRELDLSQM